MKLLWLGHIQRRTLELQLFTPNIELASTSAKDLRQLATFPYEFEHALITRRLEGLPFRDVVVRHHDADVQAAELVPGGRWLVTLIVSGVEGSPSGTTNSVLIWDTSATEEQASIPVAEYVLHSGPTSAVLPELLNVQPDEDQILIFAYSELEYEVEAG